MTAFDSAATHPYNPQTGRYNSHRRCFLPSQAHIAVDPTPILTAEEFAVLGAGGDEDLDVQRAELLQGRLSILEAPDLIHGAVVLNFSKALAAYLHKAPDEQGYAAFEIGLIVSRGPDTVRRPPVSVFVGGERFAELDRTTTDTRPALVLEIASTNDRRRMMRDRVESYLNWGVRTVWVVDTAEKTVYGIQQGKPPRTFSGDQSIPGSPVFADFKLPVSALFVMPD
ncbi:MAG TPA: Uma2 family endonuclease [Planctomycetaceae bacterium]|nr:Uma2 family endonuclease [Planctomycetaceae bacterium]